jgi:ABC-type glycerol-3-phosphate transport system permease component
MNDQASPMTTSYKVIFWLSIFMAVISVAGNPMGVFLWGFTAWCMHRRKNAELVKLYGILRWLSAIAVSIGIALSLSYINDDADMFGIGFSLVVLGSISLAVNIFLFKYFTKCIKASEPITQ